MIIPVGNITTEATSDTAEARSPRRTVTVLFIDIVGFTALTDRLDPEDVWALQKDYFALVAREVRAGGGVVEKYIGDAVMALFGAGADHQDTPAVVARHAARAVQAGLRMQDALRDHPLAGRFPVRTRVGIATGAAIVDVTAGDGGQAMISGSVVATASRLEAYAPHGTVVVCESTRRATDALIAYQDLPPVAVAGKPYPLHLWRALNAQPAPAAANRPAVGPAESRAAVPADGPAESCAAGPAESLAVGPDEGGAAGASDGARLPARLDVCTAAVPVWVGPGVALAQRTGRSALTRAGPAAPPG
jgi:class 3 adenylate cyclase